MFARSSVVLVLMLFLISAATSHAQAMRTWTDSAGRTFDAVYMGLEGQKAIFRYANGRVFTTSLNDLSMKDKAALVEAGKITIGLPEKEGLMNFGAAWPRGVRTDGAVESKVVSEDAKTGRYIYESRNYRFHCDARLTQDVLRNFAMMFETIYRFSTHLPLAMSGGKLREGKRTILLFETMQGYVNAGGPAWSGGCFFPSSGVVMVPMESLGLTRTGTGFSLDTTRKNSVLVHELAHQLTPQVYMRAAENGWFTEGLAEYFAVTPYTWGYFQPDPYGNEVLAYVTAHGADGKGGRALGKKIACPPLRRFLRMNYGEFTANGNVNYGLALLVTHYFFHMEGGGRSARITAYLKGLREGRTGEDAVAPLLGGGSYEKLEAEMAEAWRRKGVEIAFGR